MLLTESTASLRGAANEGHPVPESNLLVESNSGLTQPAQTKTPRRASFTSGDEFGGSVPPSRSTKYWPPVSTLFHGKPSTSLIGYSSRERARAA